jgi:hypothetical protein
MSNNTIENFLYYAIEDSIKFEELMDITDFDSWFEADTAEELKKYGQEKEPLNNYKENLSKLRKICTDAKSRGNPDFSDSKGSNFEKFLLYKLFESKELRLKAKTLANNHFFGKENNYQKAARNLQITLMSLESAKISFKNSWKVLIYNDLSICYAGLRNSSLSLGYAEEAIKCIEDQKSYRDFNNRLNAKDFGYDEGIEKCNFVSSKNYALYGIGLFNKAQAELRSHLKDESERDFKRIIAYAKNNSKLNNFNTFSAIQYLSSLYIDLGRGKEAIDLQNTITDPVRGLGKRDARYWSTYLEEINAMIDQTRYDEAKKLLIERFFLNENDLNLKNECKITIGGFNAINHFARCEIERVKDTVNMCSKISILQTVERLINDNKSNMKQRQQKGVIRASYKHLAEINKNLSNEKKEVLEKRPLAEKCIQNFILFFTEGKIDNLENFSAHSKMSGWINNCEDLDVLESFSEMVCQFEKANVKLNQMLFRIKEKIIRECEVRNEPQRSERVVTVINEVLGEKKYSFLDSDLIKFQKRLFSNTPKACEQSNNKDNRTAGRFNGKDIRLRLDYNEKKFDKVLFSRTKIKDSDNLVEIVSLRRWNSFSPGLFRKDEGESLGGGYLLRVNKALLKETVSLGCDETSVENIVIDPGYNFLQNFCKEDFHIEDIDTIIITHSHLDHCVELLPIMDLVFQINKRYDKSSKTERPRHRVTLCLSQGAYNKFKSYTLDRDWQEQLKDVILIENQPKMMWTPFKGLEVTGIPTNHTDLGGMKAIGLKIDVQGKQKDVSIGFTGDTSWFKDIEKRFKDCDFLCIHMGGIKYQEIGYNGKRAFHDDESRRVIPPKERLKTLTETYSKANHLLFFGTNQLLKSCNSCGKSKLIVIGEFGEELKYGLRVDLCNKLLNGEKKSLVCVPGDIGLYIVIESIGQKKIRCNFCDEFVDPFGIKTFCYGREDAIHYICQSCDNTLSDLQKQAFVEHRTTRH